MQQIRIDSIKQARDEENWISGLKIYMVGDVARLSATEAKVCALNAPDYEVDQSGLLFFCQRSANRSEDRTELAHLVVPEQLQQDFLHHYHISLECGHEGIGRTYQRIRANFHWCGLYRSVQRYIGECMDCETGKGRPGDQSGSPGNLQSMYPFQIIDMDHKTSLPRSYKGNTGLLRWVDQFRVCDRESKLVQIRTDERGKLRGMRVGRFGASEAIRHDREPGFMSDFFRAFNRIAGHKQRATHGI